MDHARNIGDRRGPRLLLRCRDIDFVDRPFTLAAMRLVLIVAGTWLALALAGSAVLAFAAVAVGIGSFAVGLLAVLRARFMQLAAG